MEFDSPHQSEKEKPILLLGKLHSFPQTALEKKLYSASKSDNVHSNTCPTYTSLKDLIPSNRRRLTRSPLQVQSAHEIPITNFLVKKAAWAYLQPMLEPSSSSRRSNNNESKHIFGRIWDDLKLPANACLRFINEHIIVKISRAFDLVFGGMLMINLV
ncbi:hypothetical protein HS088_TW02G00719 [Tripterygium wilfordii]|uniref:Uncharacterized protein n=1 Tax=Tripterygium wilfordii TaxID=458696 RepID=A0A7J7DZ72_TRIWF|nr:hypothetical protein HS088_TW02G00719 [Tripterygium wilfordii]